MQEKEEFTKMFQKIANAYEVCWEWLYYIKPYYFYCNLYSSVNLSAFVQSCICPNNILFFSFQILRDDEQRENYNYMLDNPGNSYKIITEHMKHCFLGKMHGTLWTYDNLWQLYFATDKFENDVKPYQKFYRNVFNWTWIETFSIWFCRWAFSKLLQILQKICS